MNLVYICIFLSKEQLKFLRLFLFSMILYSNMELFDLVVITTEDFVNDINNIANLLNIKLNILLTSYKDTPEKAMMDRFKIFEYPDIEKYSKLLYLDTDIIIQGKLEILFNLELADKIYGVIEHDMIIESITHGGASFDFTKVSKNIPGVNAGVLLFKNTNTIKSLFIDIVKKREDLIKNNIIYGINDQCLLNYFCIMNNLFGSNILSDYIYLPHATSLPITPLNTNIIMNHFYGGGGKLKKIDRLKYHMSYLLELFKNKESITNFIEFKFNNEHIYINKLTFKYNNQDYTGVLNKDSTKISVINNTSYDITCHEILRTNISPYGTLTLDINKCLVYFCILNKSDLDLFKYLLISIKIFSNNESFDLLVLTCDELIYDINKLATKLSINIYIKLSDSYLNIFDYENIDNYTKILYLEPDVIIKGNLMKLFYFLEDDKLYKNQDDMGVLLFKNSSLKNKVFSSDTKDLSRFVDLYKNDLPTDKSIIVHIIWPIENVIFKMDRIENYLMSLIN